MSDPDGLVHLFSPDALRMGERLFREGSAVIQTQTGTTTGLSGRFAATVGRGRPYRCTVEWSGDLLEADCYCGASSRNGRQLCEHLWAAILTANAHGRLAAHLRDRLPERLRDVGKAEPPEWMRRLQQAKERAQAAIPAAKSAAVLSADHQLVYIIEHTPDHPGVVITIGRRHSSPAGLTAPVHAVSITPGLIESVPAEEDRTLLRMLRGVGRDADTPGAEQTDSRFHLDRSDYGILARLCGTGHAWLRRQDRSLAGPVAWDGEVPWTLQMQWMPQPGGAYQLTGQWRRGDVSLALTDRTAEVSEDVLVHNLVVSPIAEAGSQAWRRLAIGESGQQPLKLSAGELFQFAKALCELTYVPPIEWPSESGIRQQTAQPTPVLRLDTPVDPTAGTDFAAQVAFDYGGGIRVMQRTPAAFFDPKQKLLLVRHYAFEQECRRQVGAAGVAATDQAGHVARGRMPALVEQFSPLGWNLAVDSVPVRAPDAIDISIHSGIDWFDVDGKARFGDISVPLPRLLEAIREGRCEVRLGNGQVGIVPEQWIRQNALLLSAGHAKGNIVRFSQSQSLLLNALLETSPAATRDAAFTQWQSRVREFDGLEPMEAPASFHGQLRPYQRDGLSWLVFLQRFGMGGCLADDMGLGKTIQVLALLEQRRTEVLLPGQPRLPTLVVAPRSLIFNWQQEAAKFTPDLRVLDYTGGARDATAIARHDLVLTTYGTLRRDIETLKDVPFDYVILDESQSIKNATTAAAQAARLLQGRHRLALSGTPIENSLSELWSLMEFLNPGLLGRVSAFREAAAHADAQTLATVAKAVRPMLLRRTKEQVASDLPSCVEETIFCELEPQQRKSYDQLREHYRTALLGGGGMGNRMQVLEALLRLRQAACHPGLLDARHADRSSAKLESLLAQLDEVLAEGHKALVFSQFTSLLAIVRKNLDQKQIGYEYLDGQTADRRRPVECFQTDPSRKLFLISLKAGGVGLNLTAADYVFLLDPWWNPAVESQAIDRAHRIGQTRHVIAYRLIAKDTVEEKVLELQNRKRQLADAILSGDGSLLSALSREDLELLLS